jgi:hypothetical protein
MKCFVLLQIIENKVNEELINPVVRQNNSKDRQALPRKKLSI